MASTNTTSGMTASLLKTSNLGPGPPSRRDACAVSEIQAICSFVLCLHTGPEALGEPPLVPRASVSSRTEWSAPFYHLRRGVARDRVRKVSTQAWPSLWSSTSLQLFLCPQHGHLSRSVFHGWAYPILTDPSPALLGSVSSPPSDNTSAKPKRLGPPHQCHLDPPRQCPQASRHGDEGLSELVPSLLPQKQTREDVWTPGALQTTLPTTPS